MAGEVKVPKKGEKELERLFVIPISERILRWGRVEISFTKKCAYINNNYADYVFVKCIFSNRGFLFQFE